MVYRYIVVPHTHETDTKLRIALLNTELQFWKTEAANLRDQLIAIPEGIRQAGSITMSDAAGEMELIEKPQEETE